MSDTTAGSFDLQGILAKLDRDRIETERLYEESRKRLAERHMRTEAEERRFRRWFPFLLVFAVVVGGLVGSLPSLLLTASCWGH